MKNNKLPPRPERPLRCGVSDMLDHRRALEKWAELAEKRIVELENNLGAWK